MRTHSAWWLACLVALASPSAWAGRKVLIVGAGDCHEPTLTSSVKDFHEAARSLLKTQLYEPEVVLDIVRPRPSRSLQDILRQIESARTLLYGGQDERGLELTRQALAELDRASPQVGPWTATAAASLLQAQLYKNLDRTKESNEAFRRVLRIDPTYTLDPDAYPPSTLATFDSLRKEITRSRKPALQVQSSPAGATVFVDGKELGQTPLKLQLIPGSYRVSLMLNDRVSFPRRVSLTKDAMVQVDMEFEGSVSQQPPLCVAGSSDDSALKLGASVTADQVIVVRNVAAPGNPPYVTAVLYELATGRQERNGGARTEMLGRLATFVVTGKEQEGVRPGSSAPPLELPVVETPTTVEPKRDAPVATPPAQDPEVKVAAEPQPPRSPEVVAAAPSGVGRVASYVLLGVGVVATTTGLIMYGAAAADRERLESLRVADGRFYPPSSDTYRQAVALLPDVELNRTLSFTVMGVGVGCAVAGVVGVLLLPNAPAVVTIAPTPHGGALAISGRF